LPAPKCFALLFFTILIKETPAQELTTDRPDQSESAVTVHRGALQIETGFAYENLIEDNVEETNYSIAGTLFRYGIFENIELRFGTAYMITKPQNSLSGLGDFLTGTKINILREGFQLIDFGILAHALLPLGSSAFNPDKVEPEVIAAFSKSVSDNFSASFNFGGSWNSEIDETFLIYSSAIGFNANDNLSAFIEAFGNVFSSYTPIHNFDGGITYLLSEDFQLDVSAGKGITGADSFWFFACGFSIRINKI
jgi:hypothetical protein